MSWTDKIPYEDLMQSALRSVVRKVLIETAQHGLIGDHHFYIAFKTQYPGVILPKRLMEKYPDEMTIVVQHRFSDLIIEDDHFEITLSFNQKPEHLVIPFAAMIGFVDPSVQFGLQFEEPDMDETALPVTAKSSLPSEVIDESDDTSGDDDDQGGQTTGKVVALDAFRKK